MKEKTYIIGETKYYDHHGNLTTQKYFIKELWFTILNRKFWRPITHRCYDGRETTYFGSVEEAETHIETVLLSGIKTETWTDKKIKEITYSYN